MHIRIRAIALACALLAAVAPGTALAEGPAPIPAPEGFAELRARFEGKSGDQIATMGYIAEPPICISEPGTGGMGVHALNIENFSAQFAAGVMDPENPPVVLLDASLERVIGLEWEAADVGKGAPEAFGQPALLLPGHPGPPGTEDAHYMLHAYFRPDGEVLFAPLDPQVSCMPDTATEAVSDWAGAPLGGPLGGPAIPVALLAGLIVAWVTFRHRLATRH